MQKKCRKKFTVFQIVCFHKILGLVNSLTAKEFSETNPRIHLNKHTFRSQ